MKEQLQQLESSTEDLYRDMDKRHEESDKLLNDNINLEQNAKVHAQGHEMLADENVESRSQDFEEDDYASQSFSQRSDEETDLTPAQKIDLWKKLQDLMRN